MVPLEMWSVKEEPETRYFFAGFFVRGGTLPFFAWKLYVLLSLTPPLPSPGFLCIIHQTLIHLSVFAGGQIR